MRVGSSGGAQPATEAEGASRSDRVPALHLRGVWKLFGPPRQVKVACQNLRDAVDRASVRRRHGVFAALAGVDLQVERRRILAIVGASGCGKSTLVRHMNGMVRPTAGTVEADGRSIGDLAARDLQRLRATRIGTVFQGTSLFSHRSVIDNVVFGLEVRRVPHAQRYRIAREWLARVELADWAEQFPHELSGGMQQRVGLARTFATDPETLLLDEPFSALDPAIRRSLQDQFVHLVRAFRKTAVFITHDFAEAVRVADRIAVMVDGRVVQVGTPREIILHPLSPYVASFATPDLKRAFACAGDLARPQAELKVGSRATDSLAADTPLSEVIRRLQADDSCFEVAGREGEAGWIDRGILLAYLGASFGEGGRLSDNLGGVDVFRPDAQGGEFDEGQKRRRGLVVAGDHAAELL